MSFAARLVGFCFRQVVGHNAGVATEVVAELVLKHFTDHSQALLAALAAANDRAWQALGVALAGDGFLDKVKLLFASGDDKGIREQVRLFLQDENIGYLRTPADFREECLAELNQARQRNLLTARNLSPHDVAHHAASFQRYGDPQKMVDGAEHAMGQIASELAADYPNLDKLLRQRPAGGSPLLVSAFAFFFRVQVENNAKLAHGLFFDGLRQLSASQDKAFAEVNKALTSLGSQFDAIIEQMGRIETVVVETRGAVLDLQVELTRIGEMNLANGDEVRRLLDEVLRRVSQLGMQRGEVKPQHSCSIRGEDERNAVKQLLARFRQMPADQQQRLPALLNGLGKLQLGSGDFENARQTFLAVSKRVADATAQAEVLFNAYRAALEERKWVEALAAIQQVASLDPQRFSPFPMQRYQPKRILGAGGFGTAFLCHDRNFDEEVVVKTLHAADMERSMTEVFREARLLRKVSHPAIIGVHECEYADPAKQARPYVVMDYFPGGSLEDFLRQRGAIGPEEMIAIARQIADGLNEAHRQNILHRDVKPDNVLVRKEGSTWQVKLIDFGLALRKQTVETSVAVHSTGNTVLSNSVAGTLKYAPPEQLGELKGVKPGPYSDVYAFGKTCCYALFGTTEPKRRHWSAVPSELQEMLEQCTERELTHRLPGFEPVLKVLEALGRKTQDVAVAPPVPLPAPVVPPAFPVAAPPTQPPMSPTPPGVFVPNLPASPQAGVFARNPASPPAASSQLPSPLLLTAVMHRNSVAVAGNAIPSYALIKITQKALSRGRSQGLNLALVIDVSGSMYEEDGTGISRLKRLQDAMKEAIAQLKDDDTVAIVAFAHNAQTVLPSTKVADKAKIESTIDSIDMFDVDPGATFMNEGIQHGLEAVAASMTAGKLTQVLVFTDGRPYGEGEVLGGFAAYPAPSRQELANLAAVSEQECRKLANFAAGKKIPLILIGLGTDWNAHLLEDLARFSGGRCYHIDVTKNGDAQRVIGEEFQQLASVGLLDVELHLRPVKGFAIERVRMVAPEIKEVKPTAPDDRHLVAAVGTLKGEHPRKYVLDLKLPKRPDGKYVIAHVEVSFDPGSGKRETTGMIPLEMQYTEAQDGHINAEVAGHLDELELFELLVCLQAASTVGNACEMEKYAKAIIQKAAVMGHKASEAVKLARQVLEELQISNRLSRMTTLAVDGVVKNWRHCKVRVDL